MNPQIGMIVLYRVADGDPEGLKNNGVSVGESLAALIVGLGTDGKVNLHVFSNGTLESWLKDVAQGDENGQWNFRTA